MVGLSSTLFLSGLLALACAGPVPFAKRAGEESSGDAPTLLPLHSSIVKRSLGIQRRAGNNSYAGLDPTDSAELAWGTPTADGKLFMANMTLYKADENKPIVSMEDFEEYTSAIDCHADETDEQLSLTFKDQQAYQYALDKWTYINDDAELSFMLIANADGCGEDDQRAVYTIHDVQNDDATFKVSFTATEEDWEQVAGTWTLDFGLLDDENAASAIARRADHDASTDVVLSVGTEHQEVGILSTEMIKIACTNCFASGTFHVVGTIKTDWFDVEQISLSVSPQAFKAALEVTTTVTLTQDNPFNTTNTFPIIPDTPIPGAGFKIWKIVEIGAFASLEAGYELSFSESVTFTTGLNMQVPDGALVYFDMANMDASGTSGFEGTTVTPILTVDAAEVAINGAVYLQPKLALTVDIIAIGKAEAALKLHVPKISAEASAQYNAAGGVCAGQSPGSNSTWGLDFNIGGSLDVLVGVSGELTGIISKEWEKTLYSLEVFHQDYCFPF